MYLNYELTRVIYPVLRSSFLLIRNIGKSEVTLPLSFKNDSLTEDLADEFSLKVNYIELTESSENVVINSERELVDFVRNFHNEDSTSGRYSLRIEHPNYKTGLRSLLKVKY